MSNMIGKSDILIFFIFSLSLLTSYWQWSKDVLSTKPEAIVKRNGVKSVVASFFFFFMNKTD